MDCSPFLNFDEEELKTESEKTVIFRSLVATLKIQPQLDAALEAKAVKVLESVDLADDKSTDAFLTSFASRSDESLNAFVQSIVVLLSSANTAITTATMEMLDQLILMCSAKVHLALVNTDLIPQIIISLHPLSLSFAEAVDIHINLMNSLTNSLWLSTPTGLRNLRIEDQDERQAVHETVLKQVVAPSEKYIGRLCRNRFSIVDGRQSSSFLSFLTRLLKICPFYRPTMDIVVTMPVVLTIPSCLTFFEHDSSILMFLHEIIEIRQEWNETRGEQRQMGKTVDRMLRMEGLEDVMESKLQNDQSIYLGRVAVTRSIQVNKLLGLNLSEQE
ncbi:hypothetical protein BLNAU_14245 [Blattamonas nauphoetae]|uniref:Uncharacterized protein n=1 Tax=Blattamonas nauphoetae TaxID=2049346 RepID=A0ABQ9XED0_9EUKA|nr:hypothetical protein BLNAU_14245 [Blattamonas nauphoetae]